MFLIGGRALDGLDRPKGRKPNQTPNTSEGNVLHKYHQFGGANFRQIRDAMSEVYKRKRYTSEE